MADRAPELSLVNGEEKGRLRLGVRTAHATDVGRRRHNNQDTHLILPLDGQGASQDAKGGLVEIEKGRLLVAVADGMGGHSRGEVASRLCVDNLAKEIVHQLQAPQNGPSSLPAALHRAVEASHRAVFAYAQSCADKLTMGTTLTAVLLHGTRAELAQVGDSRAYLFRNGKLQLLTQDQTIGNQLRMRGEDATNVDAQIQEMLVQALGAQAKIDVIMSGADLEPRDLLLLCCDGLYKVVPPAEIVKTLELEIGLQEKATHLITRANEGGGPDNITVILMEICPLESTS